MHFTIADITARRERLARQWNEQLNDDEAVLIHSGEPIQKPGGLDINYPFLPHPSYYWLTGRRREGEVVLYNKNEGWIEFQQAWTKDQAVWEGDRNDLLVEQAGKNIGGLDAYLKARSFGTVYSLGQAPGQAVAEGKTFILRTLMDQTRRIKDAAEVKLVRDIADIAAHGYRALKGAIRPGVSEKELQLAFEMEIFRRGAHTVPYDTIVGSGPNAATLHALPTARIIGDNELVLIDAGADVYDYCVDITRTFGSSAQMDSQRKDLYGLVLSVQQECIGMTQAGAWWRDVHGHAAKRFTEGLLGFGIFKGNLDTLIEKEVIALFFPHGLGHLVGLRVRDTGQEENLSPKRYFGSRLRVDLQLEPGHLITVEPGLYFIKALLEDEEVMQPYRDHINLQELEHWKNIGGVRIEDNILVTETGNENLTAAVEKAEGL